MKIAILGIVVPKESDISMVKTIAESLGARIEVCLGWDKNTVLDAAKHLEARKVDALLIRGPWSQILSETISLPVFDFNPTSHDFVVALSQARDLSRIVGIIDGYDFDEDWQSLELALGITVILSPRAVEPFEVQKYVKQVHDDGARVIIGGHLTLQETKALGIPGIYIESGRKTVYIALSKAMAYINGLQKEQERTRILQTVLDSIQEGIIAFEKCGRVIAANKIASELLGEHEIAPDSSLSALSGSWDKITALGKESSSISNGVAVLNNRKKLIFDYTPILVDESMAYGVVVLQDFGKVRKTEEAIRRSLYDRGFSAHYTFDDIVGESAVMKRTIEIAKSFAISELPVLLVGETGTGKELFAQSIHNESKRSSGPFVAVNCAALPETLLESELFGYEDGAFTGARKGGKPGLFEMAHGGTIFLDEVSSMSIAMQTKLLRVLEEQAVVRLGADRITHLNVRIITASNVDLEPEINLDRFRKDLYFRLAVLILRIPPLRARTEDIPALLKHLLRSTQFQNTIQTIPDMIERLQRLSWYGNIRELENFTLRYTALLQTGMTTAEAAKISLKPALTVGENSHHEERTFHEDEKEPKIFVYQGCLDYMLKQILEQCASKHDGSLSTLSEKLGVSKSGLWKMLKRHGIRTDRRT